MALFDDEPHDTPKPQVPVEAKIVPDRFKGIVVDTEYVPSSSLLNWIEGANWTVEYFSQKLDEHDEPVPVDVNKSPQYQQYRRIRQMELKVTNPLSFDPAEVTRTMSVTGSGITYPFLVPNPGDMFIGDIGDGRLGLFTITRATRATALRDSVYNVDFTIHDQLTDALLENLETKTVEEYHFSRDSLIQGCGPFVTPETTHRQSKYLDLRHELIERYLSEFTSRQHATFLVPDQDRVTYDHYITRAVLEMVSSDDHPRIRKVKLQNVSAESIMNTSTLWDAVIRREPTRLYDSIETIVASSTERFKGRPTLQALHFTGIPLLVFPKETPTDIDAYYTGDAYRDVIGSSLHEGRPRRHHYADPDNQADRQLIWFDGQTPDDETDPWEVMPDLHPVVIDDHYVLSEAFYRREWTSQSTLERLTWQMIESKALHLDALDALLEHVWDWDNLERFYYHPLVWALLTVGARNTT